MAKATKTQKIVDIDSIDYVGKYKMKCTADCEHCEHVTCCPIEEPNIKIKYCGNCRLAMVGDMQLAKAKKMVQLREQGSTDMRARFMSTGKMFFCYPTSYEYCDGVTGKTWCCGEADEDLAYVKYCEYLEREKKEKKETDI